MLGPARADAWERVGRGRPGGYLFTCEHASNRVPRPWRPRPHDRLLLQWHWGYDIGAAMVTRSLVRRFDATGVLARFSRLLVDPNRAPEDPSAYVRQTRDGELHFSRRGTEDCFSRFHDPFHAAVDAAARAVTPAWILSIHTFTPWYGGARRDVEAGVLFDRHDDVAEALVTALGRAGLRTAANEPYSGRAGLIYSPQRHGLANDTPYLELELRQDLVARRSGAARVAGLVEAALRSVPALGGRSGRAG